MSRTRAFIIVLLFIGLWPSLIIFLTRGDGATLFQLIYLLVITPLVMLPAVPFMFFAYLPATMLLSVLALVGPVLIAWAAARSARSAWGAGIGLALIVTPYVVSTLRFLIGCRAPGVNCGEFGLPILGLHAVLAFTATVTLGVALAVFEQRDRANVPS